jgi:serine/threonine protein kinase
MEGLKYIHSKNIVHRDIKLDNILIDLSNTIKICDFGVSKVLKSPDEIMYDQCGTPAYIAPEVFGNSGYKGFSCDIWSLGVTLYYMLEGEQPFKGRSIEELKKNICSKNYQNIELISKEAEDLLDKMLTLNPEERITLDEILKHKWIKDVDIKKRNKMKLFSKHEKYLLEKYNVCYFKDDTEDLIENFEQENLNTIETGEKNGNTKSIILAPYNTFVTIYNEPNDYINNEIKIENNICKYKGDAQVSNIKYEMSNNDKFDNGVIKTIQACSISSLSSFSQNLKTEEIKSSNNLSSDNINKNIENNFCEDIIQEIEDKVGYDKNYLIQCLKNDEVNYATATYYLMLKDQEEKSDNNNFL